MVNDLFILRIYGTCFLNREYVSQTQQSKAEATTLLDKLDVLQQKEKDLEMESRL